MSRFSPVRPALFFLVLVLGACSTVPPRDESPQVSSTKAAGAATGTIESAVPGSIVELDDDNDLGVSRVRVVDEYLAASGRLCRRVQLPRNNDPIRILCRRDNGQWSFTRALISSSASDRIYSRAAMEETLLTDDALLVTTSNARQQMQATPPVRLKMREGETLWRFSARTTGNPENWERIAEFNGIDDVAVIQSGTRLNVPADLYTGHH